LPKNAVDIACWNVCFKMNVLIVMVLLGLNGIVIRALAGTVNANLVGKRPADRFEIVHLKTISPPLSPQKFVYPLCEFAILQDREAVSC
jgi:hypothetical protein